MLGTRRYAEDQLSPEWQVDANEARAVLGWLCERPGAAIECSAARGARCLPALRGAPRCSADTFLWLAMNMYVAPKPPAGPPVDSGASPARGPGDGKVAHLAARAARPRLAKLLFDLSQAVSAGDLRSEPQALALVLTGAEGHEVVWHGYRDRRELGSAVAALSALQGSVFAAAAPWTVTDAGRAAAELHDVEAALALEPPGDAAAAGLRMRRRRLIRSIDDAASG
jgi:hypothetical protein